LENYLAVNQKSGEREFPKVNLFKRQIRFNTTNSSAL